MAQSLLYDAIGASAVAVALIGVWRNRPERRLPWVLMAIGQASFVAGDLLWNWYEFIGEDPFPSMADVLYLAGYPFIVVGLLMMIRRRVGDGDRGGLLDAAILTTAAAILSWTFLIQPQVVGSDLDAVAVHQPVVPGRRPRPDRCRDGPPHHAGGTDRPRSGCSASVSWRSWLPTRSTRSRTSTGRTSPVVPSTASTSSPTSCSAPRSCTHRCVG